MQEKIKNIIKDSVEVKNELFNNNSIINKISKLVEIITDTYKKNGKVLLCGNGGSAADAQHIAAELTGRFYLNREPMNAEALHVNTSYITSVANDYSFNEIYARLIRAQGKQGDVLIGFSTSGNSPNIIRAIEDAKALGMITICFTGDTGGKCKDICDLLINVPSNITPRIQEAHILIGHIICELVEQNLFGQK